MNIAELHWEIKFRYNKLDSNHKKDFVPAELDRLLNYSVIPDFVELVYSGENRKNYKTGFEITQQRVDMLSTLVVKYPEQPGLTHVGYSNHFGAYEYSLDDLEFPYLHLIRTYIKSDCGNIPLTKVNYCQHDDLNIKLMDKMTRPSKTWRRVLWSMGRNSSGTGTSIYVYTNDEIVIDQLFVEYIKQPTKVFFGGYDTLEFESSGVGYESGDPPVDSDIPVFYHSFLAEMAVENLSGILGDVQRIQISNNKQLNTL